MLVPGQGPQSPPKILQDGGGFYRVHVGSFATSEQATTLCNKLKDAGGQCIVQKN